MKLSQALTGYWLARRRSLSPNTQRDYALHYDRLLNYLHDPLIDDIAAADIHRYLDHVQARYKLSQKTLSNVWIALSALWSWAEVELGIPHIIRGQVPRPRYRRPPILPYTEADLRALLLAAERDAGRHMRHDALRDRAILLTLIDTGLRASELCDLTLRDYDAETGRLNVRHGKGDKQRVVFAGDGVRRALWKYLATRPEAQQGDALFATRNNTAILRTNLLQLIVRTAARAGVSNANVHRFRHTFAITFLRNGGNLLELQRLLGHERMDTLHIYVQLAQQDLAAAQRSASPVDRWRL